VLEARAGTIIFNHARRREGDGDARTRYTCTYVRAHLRICTCIFRFCRTARHCPRDSIGVSAASGFSTNYFPPRESREPTNQPDPGDQVCFHERLEESVIAKRLDRSNSLVGSRLSNNNAFMITFEHYCSEMHVVVGCFLFDNPHAEATTEVA